MCTASVHKRRSYTFWVLRCPVIPWCSISARTRSARPGALGSPGPLVRHSLGFITFTDRCGERRGREVERDGKKVQVVGVAGSASQLGHLQHADTSAQPTVEPLSHTRCFCPLSWPRSLRSVRKLRPTPGRRNQSRPEQPAGSFYSTQPIR